MQSIFFLDEHYVIQLPERFKLINVVVNMGPMAWQVKRQPTFAMATEYWVQNITERIIYLRRLATREAIIHV